MVKKIYFINTPTKESFTERCKPFPIILWGVHKYFNKHNIQGSSIYDG